MQKSLSLIIAFSVSFLSLLFDKVQAQTNQVVSNGQATSAANFPGGSCVYNWINDKPAIGLAGSGTGDIASFTAVNTGTSPIVATITATPQINGFAYVPGYNSSNVAVIDVTTNAIVKTIPVGSTPVGVAVSPDNSLVYVTNATSKTVSVISTANNTVVKTISVGVFPYGIVVTPDGKRAYVANQGSGTVSVINTAGNTVVKVIPVGGNPLCFAVSPDGRFVYLSDGESATIWVIDTSSNAVVNTFSVDPGPIGMSVSPDGKKLFIANELVDAVTVINTADYSTIIKIPVGSGPYSTVLNPDGSKLYVTNAIAGTVSVINTSGYDVSKTIPVGQHPYGISVNADGSEIYVANGNSNTVSVIDAASNAVASTINVGSLPLSLGNFITGKNAACSPVSFTITVNPAVMPSVITAGAVTGSISACAGSASASPNIQQFTLSGSKITGGVTVTAPAGFDVSFSAASGYASSSTFTSPARTINNKVIYVRSSASAPTGNISGNVVISTPGATDQTVAVKGVVNALPVINPVSNQTYVSGQITPATNFTGTGNTFTWTNDKPGIGLSATGVGSIPSFTATNTGNSPVTATITVIPASNSLAYITNAYSNTVSVINTGTNAVIATIPVGKYPDAASASPVGSRVYIVNNALNNVSVINIQTNAIIATIPVGAGASGSALTPDGSKLYVANYTSSNISVISTATNTVTATITAGTSPNTIVASADGSRIYVTNSNSASVSVISTANNAVISTIPVGSYPVGLTVSLNGSRLYVTNENDGTVSVVNTATDATIATIPVQTTPSGIAVTPDGSRVYVVNSFSFTVSVIDAATNTVIATVPTEASPNGIAVTPDGSEVYVLNANAADVSVINTKTNTVIQTIPVQGYPQEFGNFMSAGSGCTGVPTTFTITVNPASSPAIVAGTVTGTISACAGSASASPNIQQFTVSGSNLANNITATAPNGFEVSLSPGSGYNTSIFITPSGSSVSNTIVYVRSSAPANAGNISGNVVLTSPGAPSQNVAVTGVVNALPTVNAVASQSLNNGTTTAAINFTGTASTFTWINDTPGIGLPASGSGNIAPFTAVNNDIAPVTATIRVTPSSTGASCSGAPATFTITVAPDPYATTPAIIAGAATGTITACAGSPSASPNIQQFTVSGSNLTGNIIATAPAGFEVSLNSATGYSNNATLVQNAETVNNTVIYVRSAASAPAGNISGNVVLSSTGAISQKVAVNGTVNALPTVNTIPNQTVTNGAATAAVNFTGTASTFTWVNNTPAIGLAASGSGNNIASFTATNNGSSPVTATITVTPVPSGGFAYIANETSNSVSVIDLTTNNVVTTIPVGQSPYAVAATPDKSTLYVTGLMYGTVSVINTATNAVTATITVGEYPSAIVVSPDGKYVYVADQSSNDVAKIDVATNTVLSTFYSGGDPNSLWLSPDGSKLYALCYANNQLFVINTTNQTILKSIPVGQYPLVSAITPDASMLYVTNYGSNNVSVISTQTNSVISTITVGQSPKGITISPDGTTAYVSNLGDNTISVINTATNTVVKTIDLGFKGGGLSLNNDGSLLYVTNFVANNVSVINTSTNAVVTTIPVGSGPESYGNFVVQGLGCTGKPTTFTITVNPSTTPVINVGLVTGTIIACAGSPSASPNIEQFTVSGSNLTGDIKMTAPSGFEVSLTQGSGYNGSLTLPQSGGTVANTVVYVRSSSLAFAGAISGNVVITSIGATNQNVAVSGVINAIPVVNQPISLTYINGQSAGVNFAGTADTYSWVNDQPGIGLAASGTGNIGLFNVVNTGNSPVIATIQVTPSNSTGCDGSAKTFTITVNPTPSGISVGGRLSALNTVYGTPSSRESFTISGTNLNAKVTITAPAGFEVSADGDTFSGSVNISAPGTLASTDIYIRLAATTPVGNYSGNIVVASAGATSVNVAMPNSTVRPAPLVITADDKTRFYETPNPDFTVQYNGFVNNENTSVLTKQPVAATTATVTSLPGQYPITVSGASSPNYSISFVSGILKINPALQAIIIPNVFTPNGDGINDKWDITNLEAYVTCTVDVFSRYGQKVFSSVGYNATWDGTRNNVAVPAGTYYYIINLNNGQKVYAGYVTIIR